MATVDLVIPVYNEERVLRHSVETTLRYLETLAQHTWRTVIANNASTDGTWDVARALERDYPGRVVAQYIPVKGRGIALRTTWLTSDADVCAYMDVDLATDLRHLPELIDPIAGGEVDLAFGTRLDARSETTRGFKRTFTSKAYVFILNRTGLRVSDAQCGFKAISREAARALVPLTRDTQWFFDSELLWIAQENGYRMREVPVSWRDDPDSRVHIVRTALEDLRGIWRLRRGGIPRTQRGTAGMG